MLDVIFCQVLNYNFLQLLVGLWEVQFSLHLAQLFQFCKLIRVFRSAVIDQVIPIAFPFSWKDFSCITA